MIEVLAARGAWCRPEESILWLLPLKKEGGMPFVLYRVSGRDAVGKRRTVGSALGKGFKAVGGFAVMVPVEALLGSGDSSDANVRTLSHAIVTGGDKDCLAARRLADFQPANEDTELHGNLAWVLTDQRLGLLQFGALEKLSLVDAVADIFRRGEKTSGPPEVTVRAEIPRAEIAGVQKVDYRYKFQPVHGLRVTLTDDSTLDLTGTDGGNITDRLLDMAHGRE